MWDELESFLTSLPSAFLKLLGLSGGSSTPSSSPSSSTSKPSAPIPLGSFSPPIRGGWRNLGGFSTAPYMVGNKKKNNHLGLDMGASVGTPIYAIGPGVVSAVWTEASNKLGGNSVYIKHDNGAGSYYAHMNSTNVKVGDKVTSDTVVGTVGNTGNAKNTSSHLHIEVSMNGSKVDPLTAWSSPAPKVNGPQTAVASVQQVSKLASNYNMICQSVLLKSCKK